MRKSLTRHERALLDAAERYELPSKEVTLAVIVAAARKGDRGAQRWLEEREVEWSA